MEKSENKNNFQLRLKEFILIFGPYLLTTVLIVAPWFFRSGYLFLTDMAWGPNIVLDWRNSWFLFYSLVKILSFVFPVAFLQKIVVTGTLLLILLGGRALVRSVIRLTDGQEAPNSLVFILSLFALFNPFVYDRALYGQLGILLAYGFLLVISAYLITTWQTLNWRYLRLAALFSSLVLMFAVHFIFLLAPFYLLFFIGLYLKRKEMVERRQIRKFWSAFFISIFIVVALNINWFIPIVGGVSHFQAVLKEGITQQDLFVFQTAGRTSLETFTNVLLMSGFWGKDQFRYLDLTDVSGWQRSFILLSPIIFYGVFLSFRRRRDGKIFSIGLLIIFVLAVILAVGVKAPVARGLTLFLYDHLPGYKGLREPQKWVAIIIPIYLFYLTLGAYRLKSIKFFYSNRALSGLILTVIIIMLAPSLLWGFGRQVVATPYPADWYETDEFLLNRSAQSSGCTDQILFLPWHLYMSFNWTQKIIANPASSFFTCPVLSGLNMEFGGIYDNSQVKDSMAVSAWLANQGRGDPPMVSAASPRYIILAKEVDWISYDWLSRLDYLLLIKQTQTLLVYEIKS